MKFAQKKMRKEGENIKIKKGKKTNILEKGGIFPFYSWVVGHTNFDINLFCSVFFLNFVPRRKFFPQAHLPNSKQKHYFSTLKKSIFKLNNKLNKKSKLKLNNKWMGVIQKVHSPIMSKTINI